MTEQITVTPTQTNGKVMWTLCYHQQCGGPAHPTNKAYPPIMLPANGSPYDFQIVIGQPDLGITFAQDPMWIAPGKGVKPPPKSFNSHNQIGDISVSTDGKVLSLTDHNSNMFPKWFSYQLNFVRGSQPTDPLDPDWHNGGGGFTLYFATAEIAAMTLIAMVVLLSIGFGLGRYTMARKIGARGVKG
jgi:hypothetical protein